LTGSNIGRLGLKIAAVVQRYGEDVVGGERLCREVTRRLSRSCDVTVLTSCARDYVSWANHYQEGESLDQRVRVLRFPVKFQRPVTLFDLVSGLILQRRVSFFRPPLALQKLWVLLQGPYCPGLLEYIRTHRGDFDAFLFYTYLYYPTAFGLPLVAEKSILIPTAHDERPIYLPLYRRVLQDASALIFLSAEEQDFVNKHADVCRKPQRVASMKVPCLGDLQAQQARVQIGTAEFRKRRGIIQPYFLYLGRVDPIKGTNVMLSYFHRFVEDTRRDVLLLLAGESQMRIPPSPALRYLGFLNERDKRLALAGCEALLLFSPFESYSMSLLEAFGSKKPAIVTAESPVLRGHIERSRAGFAVSSYEEFRSAAEQLLDGKFQEAGENGLRYVKEHYSWEEVEAAYLELIDGCRRNV
jgi:glycosyltransferase involved in cell wall biosynthesis